MTQEVDRRAVLKGFTLSAFALGSVVGLGGLLEVITFPNGQKVALAKGVIEKLNIEPIQRKIVHYLSGGEKKKVALAGALVLEPDLLILDEPFAGLDPVSRRDLVQILNKLNREKKVTLIMTLHEVDLVAEVTDVLYLMHGHGDLSERGTPQEIFGKFKDLESFNLEEPALIRLFKGLKEEGLDFGVPLQMDEAIEAIKKHWDEKK